MPHIPLVLIILDGFGFREEQSYNAIAAARTPQWDFWWENCPHTLLQASGHTVGLPEHQMGNSEVGHMHMGAGRRIPQDFTRINEAINNHTFDTNETLIDTIHHLKENNKTLHILGLLSKGGVHSHEEHLFAFLALCSKHHFSRVALHLFLDGRDTPPQSALSSLEALKHCLNRHPVGFIASITGRYYALDRDKRWDRIEPVYKLLTEGQDQSTDLTAEDALKQYYEKGIYDEFIPPTQLTPHSIVEEGDSVFFFNFRADRARELTQAFLSENFDGFHRVKKPKLYSFCTMTHYDERLSTKVIFPPLPLKKTFGEVISDAGLSQLRLAETEKYAHVTFFFNGGYESSFPGETRLLIPSPKVATYDLQPEMSAPALTKVLVEAISNQTFDVIICNYANADMVGHTGNIQATIQAIECIDHCMHDVGEAIKKVNGQLIITADHGNAECMFDEISQQPQTAHTNEPVPFLYVGNKSITLKQQGGDLSCVAPTLLDLLSIQKPLEMTGTSLLTSVMAES